MQFTSIHTWPINIWIVNKIHTCWITVVFKFIIEIIDLVFEILIFKVYYAGECNFYGVVLVNFFIALTNFFSFFTMLQLFCKSLVPSWITTMSDFSLMTVLICLIRSSFNARGWGQISTELPRDTPRLLTFLIIESPMITIFVFSTFRWWASGWKSLKLTCRSSNLPSFWTFGSFFLSFRKVLFPVVWLILFITYLSSGSYF